MKKKALHPKQEKLLLLMKENIDDPLTIRDLQEAADISSPSLALHHIRQLERSGYIKRNPGNPRDYQIIGNEPEKKVAFLNLYGFAQCGPNGSILDGSPIDRIAVSTRLLTFPASEGFLVKAKGPSMEPKIHEGDYVIAKKTTTIDSGSVAVCVNDGETIIKRVSFGNGKPILTSINEEVCPPFIAADDFRIEGEVKGIISYQF